MLKTVIDPPSNMTHRPQALAALALLSASLIASSQADLVAHWPLDTDARDALGKHDGSASGVVFGAEGAALHTGDAAEFDGSSATITVPFADALNTENFTLSMWVNADSTGGFASPVTSRDDTPASVHGYIIYNDNNGSWNFCTGTGGPSGAWDTLPGEAVEVGSSAPPGDQLFRCFADQEPLHQWDACSVKIGLLALQSERPTG